MLKSVSVAICQSRILQLKKPRQATHESISSLTSRICFGAACSSYVRLRQVLQLQPALLHGQVRQISKKEYQFPEVKESDLEERFVRGHGPGGQAVNQTANCVVLKHIPTGIVVKCHATRSLETNRKQARERLRNHLDLYYNGESSFQKLEQKEETKKEIQREKRSRHKLELKKAFKKREGLD